MAETSSPPKSRIVLIAIDGSEYSKYAFEWYCKSMHRPTDHVVMIHSVEFHAVLQTTQWYYTPYSFDTNTINELMETEAMSIKEKLEHFAQMMREHNINGTVKSIHANRPGEGIINAAREANADVIITGSRGTGKLRRTFLGSVSDYVLHHSDVPVIVCRHKDHHHHHHGDKHDQDVK
uniref:Uncharacterized protein LOC111108723 n=1 Tax=Crassostrea virginica TaxID=6565 RepID=A0A8B8BBX5_CRAVI|nr:uncharacterized protein LOC111108723 [Crassostrea virginica]